MALSIILRGSASRVNRFYGNLILAGASVPLLRQFCSSLSLSNSQGHDSLVKEAKQPSFDETLVKDLLSQVQSLQRDLEFLRKSYGNKPLSAENESFVGGDDSSLKHILCEDSQSDKGSEEGEESETNKSDDDDDDDSDDDGKEKSSSGSNNSDDKPDNSLPKSKENEELVKEIQAEIMLAKKFAELSAPDAIVPDDFPFEIKSDYDGQSSIVLSREYEGELVQVQVKKPKIFMQTHCNDYNEQRSSSFIMYLTVLVSCMTSKFKKVEFKCDARPEGIYIYTAKDPADGSDNDGVLMSEFNKNLKGEFVKYLEARGITVSTATFLYSYMLDKANRDKLRTLEHIQKMVV